MEKLDPPNLSTFAFHLFQASLFPKLFVGVMLSLDKYFRHLYWKKMKPSGQTEPTQNSLLEAFPEGRFLIEEDVIISQIFYEMEYNFPEESLSNALKVSVLFFIYEYIFNTCFLGNYLDPRSFAHSVYI